jgi:hypothetical protein
LKARPTAAVLVARWATGAVQSMTPESITVSAVSVHVPKETMMT